VNPVAVTTSTRDGRFGEVAVNVGSIVFRVVVPLGCCVVWFTVYPLNKKKVIRLANDRGHRQRVYYVEKQQQ